MPNERGGIATKSHYLVSNFCTMYVLPVPEPEFIPQEELTHASANGTLRFPGPNLAVHHSCNTSQAKDTNYSRGKYLMEGPHIHTTRAMRQTCSIVQGNIAITNYVSSLPAVDRVNLKDQGGWLANYVWEGTGEEEQEKHFLLHEPAGRKNIALSRRRLPQDGGANLLLD